jgi:hypothetical protein
LGKYEQTKYLKKTKARTFHQCDLCAGTIEPTEYYYAETQDRFLQSLHAMHFCSKCYEKFGVQLLNMKQKKTNKKSDSKPLNDFF